MLRELTVKDIVLIERLDLELGRGLTVLTGETGAGKSILLDALGLALGGRAEGRLLRAGAEQASVTAVFDLGSDHPVWDFLKQQDFVIAPGELVLRRTLMKDGRTRAYLNDEAVSIGLLRQLGDLLVEVQGQFEQRGLLDPSTHRGLLDAFAGVEKLSAETAKLWARWRDLRETAEAAAKALEEARRDEAWLAHVVKELEAIQPRAGEEAELSAERALLMSTGKIQEALAAAQQALSGRGGAEAGLATALRELERAQSKAQGKLDAILETLNRASAEASEAILQIQSLKADSDLDPGRLEAVESRFFALKDLARKHACQVDDLAPLFEVLSGKLSQVRGGDEAARKLWAEAKAAEAAYRQSATALHEGRSKAAKRLDAAVMKELPPLKLERARFQTEVELLPEADWGPDGADQIAFQVSTNPGSTAGPLAKIASGGELARFLLALKVVLARLSPVGTLVFDEVDAGIGGATADAVGERLARLAEERQILVVTHSPQVAARGRQHWRVAKSSTRGSTATEVGVLEAAARNEEVARMLAGAEITEEARAAARRLLEAAK